MKAKIVFLMAFLAIFCTKAAFADKKVKISGIKYRLEKTGLVANAWVTSNFYVDDDLMGEHNYKGDVVIPETIIYEGTSYTVVGIDAHAFSEFYIEHWDEGDTYIICSNDLKSVTIPNSVTSIGNNAFYGCSSLTSVTIGNSVTSIGSSAFSGCSSLTSVNITDLEAWCKISFSGQESSPLSYAHHLFLNGEEIIDLVIPNSATKIGWGLFSNCSSLASVTIPNSVTNIGSSAFFGCSSLTSVTIPNSVTSIGSSAFSGCSSLTSVAIPESVTSIGSSVFSNCSSLTSVTIPNSVTSIGSSVFSDCSNLTSVSIPESITNIGTNTFSGCSNLTSITIPESITSIGNFAFSGCSSLTSVIIPESVTSIGNNTFSGCSGLTSVIIPESVTSIGNNTFSGCSRLTSVIIPESVTNIGNFAFSGCSRLTSVTIPESVTSIGNEAFSDCISLTSVTIPKSVTVIGGRAFYGCLDLKRVTFNCQEVGEWFSGFTSIEKVEIGDGVKSIGTSAFKGCIALNTLTIGKNVTSIGNFAFSGCSCLPVVDNIRYADTYAIEAVDKEQSSYKIKDGTKWIGNSVFSGCISLTSVTIPESVTSIGSSAFYNCNRLTSITIPESVTSIGSSAFYNCSRLTSVTIPGSVTSIGAETFQGCSRLTSVTIPGSVTSIGYGAFSGCSNLPSVTIPNSVTNIGSSAFKYCSSLTSVTIGNSVTSIGSSAFSGCSSLTSVNITDLEAWCKISFSGQESSPLSYAHHLFLNGEEIIDLVIPNSATSIGNFAFSGCISLTSVTIPELVTNIGDYAFSGCTGLKHVAFNCREVGTWFSGFTTIEKVEIGDGVENIGASAFKGCTTLNTLTIGKNVTSIGNQAFSDCSNLKSVTSHIKTPFGIDNSVFQYSVSGSTILYVPFGTKQSYQNTSAWNQFLTILEISDEDTGDDVNVDGFTLCGKELQTLAGTQVVLPIELINEDEVKLCQFDLQLPAGVTVAAKSNGKLDARLTERAENHSVSSQQLSNGDYRFIVSSMDNDSFTGYSGTLMEIMLDIPATTEPGEYIVKVLNAEVSVPDGNDLKVVKPADAESKLIVKDYTPGDVNNDGSVSVTDVGCAINYILEQFPSVFNFDAADMNGDKSISVTDVGIIINYILNDGAFSPHRALNRDDNDNAIIPNFTLQPTEGGYELQLENKSGIVGFQFDVELSGNIAINDVQLNEAFCNDHLLNYRCLGNGKWRVVCYSLANSTFADDEEALLKISTSCDITISDIRLTTVGLDELRLAAIVGMSTEIANVEQGKQVIVRGQTLCITSDCDTTLQLFTLGGSVYRTLHVRQGVNNFNDLPAGIYLIDHKKIIIQ